MGSQTIDVALVLPFSRELAGINEATNPPSLGIAYLASVLESHGFIPYIIDAGILKIGPEETANKLAKLDPRIVGISVNIFTGKAGIVLSQELRKMFGSQLKIFFGGPFPTSNPQKFLLDGLADAVVIGEGEITFLEIVQKIIKKGNGDLRDTAGIAYLDKGEIKFNAPPPVIENLDSLPFPAWHLFPALPLYKTRARKTPVFPILTSRGCPFNCVFCSKDVFKSVFRPRSPLNVIAEIDHLVKEFGLKQLDVMDDNFSLDRKRTMQILDLLIERNYNLAINLQLGVRVDSIDEEVINKMRKAGIFKIGLGIESGDKDVLKNIKKKYKSPAGIESNNLGKESRDDSVWFFYVGTPRRYT